jgi:hypothetical protein
MHHQVGKQLKGSGDLVGGVSNCYLTQDQPNALV